MVVVVGFNSRSLTITADYAVAKKYEKKLFKFINIYITTTKNRRSRAEVQIKPTVIFYVGRHESRRAHRERKKEKLSYRVFFFFAAKDLEY